MGSSPKEHRQNTTKILMRRKAGKKTWTEYRCPVLGADSSQAKIKKAFKYLASDNFSTLCPTNSEPDEEREEKNEGTQM